MAYAVLLGNQFKSHPNTTYEYNSESQACFRIARARQCECVFDLHLSACASPCACACARMSEAAHRRRLATQPYWLGKARPAPVVCSPDFTISKSKMPLLALTSKEDG